ncbi:MAG TPA: tyrosine recombinase XerC [Clostridia bacterium]|nr:tyrosine recombinase XerC [Clostridia bacterium]
MRKYSEQESPRIIRDFCVYMETIRGKSPGTVQEYYTDLRTFFRFIKQYRNLCPKDAEFDSISIEDVDLSMIGSVTLHDIYEYLFFITRVRRNNASTRSRKISSLRSFYKYLCDKTGVLRENPTQNLEMPKKKKSLPKYLTLEESIDFLNGIDGEYRERDFCIMILFLNCGLRLSELVGLNLSDIHDNYLTVTGKGNKERSVYLNDACSQALSSYRSRRPNEGVKDKDALFLSRFKTRISPKTIQWIVKKYLKTAGLSEKGYSTHKLRHTAATLMYQHGGVDIKALQEILGHENLNTTEIYTHISNSQLEKAAKSSPLANFKIRKASKNQEP